MFPQFPFYKDSCWLGDYTCQFFYSWLYRGELLGNFSKEVMHGLLSNIYTDARDNKSVNIHDFSMNIVCENITMIPLWLGLCQWQYPLIPTG